MPRIGQITLVSDTVGYCKVSWGRTDAKGSCSFAVYIPTHRGESWQIRRNKAIAEAQRMANAFLKTMQSEAV